MKLATLGLLCLVFLAVILTIECKPRKKAAESLDTTEEEDYTYNDENAIDESPEDESEEVEKPKKKKPESKAKPKKPTHKKPSKKDSQDDDSDDEPGDPVYVCGKKQICTCDKKELTCDKVLIGDNALETLNIEVKDEDFVVETATITNNKIKRLFKDYILRGQESSVIKLDLSNNMIMRIDEKAFDDFTNLVELDLSHNKLEHVNPKVFTVQLGGLHKLWLDNNRIKKITARSFADLTELTLLSLDYNPKMEISKTAFPEDLKHLEKLSLDFCDIASIDDNMFQNLVNLKELSLIGNPLVSIPKAINAMPNLIGLDLSETSITEVKTKEITDDHQLTELRMLRMPYLYMIGDCAFCGLPNLKKLILENSSQLYDFDNNAFGTVDKSEGDFEVPTLTELNLKNCNFSTLDPELLSWEKIETLSLSGNPLKCDCEMSWLINVQKLHNFADQPTCAGPEEFAGKTFSQLAGSVCAGDGGPSKSTGSRNFAISFLMLIGVIGAIAGFMFYTRRIKLTNVFYSPEVPDMGYRNLTVQQNHEDERELRDDFTPRPDATL